MTGHLATALPRGASGNCPTEDTTAEGRTIEGFTLIELLVVLVLTATMATMVVGVMGQLRPIRAIEDHARLQRAADRIADVMADDIRNALPLPLLSPGPEGRSMIVAKDRIEFVAVVRTGFRTSGLRQVRYFLGDAEGGTKALMRQVLLRSARQSEGARKAAADEVLARVDGLEFGFAEGKVDRNVALQTDGDRAKRVRRTVRFDVTVGSRESRGESVRTVSLSE